MARACVRALGLPPPYARYRPGHTERVYTNPYAGPLGLYPCPRPLALQARYAAWLAADAARRGQRIALDEDRVMFTAGSIAGIEFLIRAFCEPGSDAIGVQSPVFPIYAHQALANGVRVVDVPLGGSNLDEIDVDAVVGARTRLTFVCRPNNPVGSVPRWSAVEELARRVDGLLVVDEAYAEFCDAPSALGLLGLGNVAVLRTFSKAWGLASVRAGAVIAPPDVLEALRVVADPFAFDGPAQQAVRAALDAPDAALVHVEALRRQRDALAARLSALPGVRVLPSETNFLLVALPNAADLPPTDRLLAPSSVPGMVRVAIGTPSDDEASFALLSELAGR